MSERFPSSNECREERHDECPYDLGEVSWGPTGRKKTPYICKCECHDE